MSRRFTKRRVSEGGRTEVFDSKNERWVSLGLALQFEQFQSADLPLVGANDFSASSQVADDGSDNFHG